MKEAYGGVFSIWLFMIFFVIYVCFIAVALQFAKTYRVKNYVINVLEQYQYTGTGVSDGEAISKLDNYLDGVPYHVNTEDIGSYCSGGNIVSRGVCIIPEGTHYKVTVFFVADFPFLGIRMTIPVSGETQSFVDWREIS